MSSKMDLNTGLKLLVRSSAIVFFGIVMSKIFTYIYRIIIARYFGPEVYGLFSLSVMVIGWFIALALIGFEDGLLRYISVYRGKNSKKEIKFLLNSSLRVLVFTGILLGLILFLSAEFISVKIFHEPGLILYLKVFSLIVPLSAFAYYYLAAIRAYEEISWYSFIFNISQNVAKVVFLVILVYLGAGAASVPFSYLLGIVVMLLISYFVFVAKIPKFRNEGQLSPEARKKLFGELLSYSIPLMFFGILSTVFVWIDSFTIGYLKNATQVGLYNAAVPIAFLLNITPLIFIQLFFPLVSKEYGRGNIHLIDGITKQVGKWIFMINFPVFIVIFFFPGAVLNLFFGKSYLAAETALRFLAVGTLAGSTLRISNQVLSMAGKSRILFIDVVVSAALNIILNFILVPMPQILSIDNSSGIHGAAIATMISMFVFNTLFLIQARHYVHITPLNRKMVSIIASGLIAGYLLWYTSSFFGTGYLILALQLCLFGAVYLLILLLTKGFDENDLMILKTIRSRIPI